MKDILGLIGREANLFEEDIVSHEDDLRELVTSSRFLVIGGAGSIGQAVVREVFKRHPSVLHVVDISENNMVELVRDIRSTLGYINGDFRTFALDCGSQEFQALLGSGGGYDYVLNLSALKHVRSEKDPFTLMRLIKVNVLNTIATIQQFRQGVVRKYFCVSTDKAANPVNMMGASKRIAEMIVQDTARRFPERRIGIVRFGNVLDSSGSVVPLFREQIKKRMPITVTHPEITRYFMSIGEAARLVIQAGAMSKNGEVFLLDMGSPVRIRDLALQMIELSGLIPEKDIPLQFTGLRPGEKLYEELLIDPAQSQPTRHPRIYSSEEPLPESEVLKKEIQQLSEAISKRDLNSALDSMKRLVPEYNPENGQ